MKRTLIIMGIITTILNLFGFSGQTKKNDNGLSKDVDEQFANLVEVFKNRPIYKELKQQIIAPIQKSKSYSIKLLDLEIPFKDFKGELF